MKKLFNTIYYIVLTAIVCIALLLIISTLPINGNIKFLTVLSGSMEPTIHTGSVVIVRPESQYNIGDIVTFGKETSKDVPTTHRIVSDRAEEGVMIFATKGDANDSPDTTETSQSDIHGRVLFSVPFAGYVFEFVRKPIGFVVVIILPVLFVVFSEIMKIVREVKKVMAKKKAENKTQEDA